METQIKEWLGSGSINIFGMPYAGKDTQAELLAKEFGGQRLSGGEILRNSVIPPHVKEAINAGNLAPTQEYIDIVLPYLSRPEFAGKPLILSSVGRWHGEEEGVLRATEQSGHKTKSVVFLHINEDVFIERWTAAQSLGDRGERADDAQHILDNRLAEFREKTLPVLEYYRERHLLIEVDGSQDVSTVNRAIMRSLAAHAGIE